MKELMFPSGATNDVFLLYEHQPIPPLSRHHIEPVPGYSNVGGSHRIIAGQSADDLSSIFTIKDAAPSRPEDNI